MNGSGFVPVGSGSRQPDVPPVRAASTIVVREGAPLEVLMLRRSDASSFVPGAWVFPGGAVDAIDASFTEDEEEISILRACAHRELFEETGLWAGERPIGGRSAAYTDLHRLSPPHYEAFLPVSRWITPRGVPKRFDTTFSYSMSRPAERSRSTNAKSSNISGSIPAKRSTGAHPGRCRWCFRRFGTSRP